MHSCVIQNYDMVMFLELNLVKRTEVLGDIIKNTPGYLKSLFGIKN